MITVFTGMTSTLVIGVLAGVLVYYCISKHQSHRSKSELSLRQQHCTGPIYEEMFTTSGEEKIEMKENTAYEPVQP